jgi:hypothetical protein
MQPELSRLKNYINSAVIDYFCHHHPEFSEADGHQLFTDLLVWMWLKHQRAREGKATYLFGPLLILDEMWHVFILHTRDYMHFSLNYFGEYVHHEVEPIGLEHRVEEDELRDYLHDCFKYLDKSWVERRFAPAFV